MYARPMQVKIKVHFDFWKFIAVTYDIFFFIKLSYRRCLNGSRLFPLLKQLLVTETTISPPIVVRECIFKNQNLCFASRLRITA